MKLINALRTPLLPNQASRAYIGVHTSLSPRCLSEANTQHKSMLPHVSDSLKHLRIRASGTCKSGTYLMGYLVRKVKQILAWLDEDHVLVYRSMLSPLKHSAAIQLQLSLCMTTT